LLGSATPNIVSRHLSRERNIGTWYSFDSVAADASAGVLVVERGLQPSRAYADTSPQSYPCAYSYPDRSSHGYTNSFANSDCGPHSHSNDRSFAYIHVNSFAYCHTYTDLVPPDAGA